MLTIILLCLLCLMIVPAIFGSLILFHIFIRDKTSPVDKSNRINHLRLVWFAMTREELFVDTFDWLKNDEYDNMR